MKKAVLFDYGRMAYEICWDYQHKIHQARDKNQILDCLFLGEHDHVFTFGRSGQKNNLLIPEFVLRRKRIPCITVERGGDVTYHGPGQLVAYPIFLLKETKIDVIAFMALLEEVMIRVLKDYGLSAERDERNRGVWVKGDKVGFVGIAVQKGITLHGLSLNVDPDLSFFNMMNPCGLKGVKATSMTASSGRSIPMEEVKKKVVHHFEEVLDLSFEKSEDVEAYIQKVSGRKNFSRHNRN